MNILLCITGGIASYKMVNLVSLLKKQGHNVKVAMTKDAEKLVSINALETMSKNSVYTELWESDMLAHIELGKWADILMVCPATFNTINKIANGIADNIVTTIISAFTKKVYIYPAMNTNMYNNPILQNNLQKLKDIGYNIIEPTIGSLACEDYGKGKLISEEEIVNSISTKKNGIKVLITAGPTREYIDPIRYITNNSSGIMGYNLARISDELGFDVKLILGPCNLEDKPYIQRVVSAEQMYQKVKENIDQCDIFISCAAVADYTVLNYSDEKIKKTDGNLQIEFKRTKDILYEMAKNKKDGQIFVGFAAETNNLIENGKKKLEKKNLDMIIVNDANNMGLETNEVNIITKDENIQLQRDTKYNISKKIIEYVKGYYESNRN